MFIQKKSIKSLPASLKVRQQGFVLILSLVMLTMLTLIGVSSMNSASTELKATANAQHHQIAFDSVISFLEYVRSDPVAGSGVNQINYQDTTVGNIQPVALDDDNDYFLDGSSELSAETTYLGCAKALGGSLEDGKGFSHSYFNTDATGSNKTGSSTSLQTQGVKFVAAAC